jgi:hypothetical protein
MVYYLGKDVQVYITTETDDVSILWHQGGHRLEIDAATFADSDFAHRLLAGTLTDANKAVTDLTGVDIGIGVQDEDISYVGGMNVLKAEIKKETTVSLTRKKSSALWDQIYCGPTSSAHAWDTADVTHGARWGVAYDGSSAYKISNGLFSPSEHFDSTVPNPGDNRTFGYRVHIRLKSGGQWLSIPGCQVTGHTVSINGDGTTEETMEFSSNVDLKIGSTAGSTERMSTGDM